MKKLNILILILILLFCSFHSFLIFSSDKIEKINYPNKFGIWLWFIEDTSFKSHEELANFLSKLGIRRIYIKVGDGSYNPNEWPEINDNKLSYIYNKFGIEVWAWSYNYPKNEADQAKNLYFAAKNGYKGYVIDIEDEFENQETYTEKLFNEFYLTKLKLRKEKIIDENFKIYCTTFSNPSEKNIYINIIDKYVDGFMPQTYFEEWGESFLKNFSLKDYEYWIDKINQEFRNLGCTKPIYHIFSILKGKLPADLISKLLIKGGKESSLWRIPSKENNEIINLIKNINWYYRFDLFSF
ncbi:MAG: hypothetical protein N3A58_03345 [Spirochaetes bacterium]|nr:hypothetical protein [Spirochaetota bacterium]